jgi:hypothetical protein
MRRYPYQRFLQFHLTLLEQLHYSVLHRPYWMLQRWLDRLWHSRLVWRWIGEPLHDRKYSPWVTFSADTRTPIVTDPNQFECRTRHGVAVVYWNCSRGTEPSPLRAKNALLPDGTRGVVQSRTVPWWRRKGSGDKIWIMGDIDIRTDDVVFVDRASQDLRYDPPAVEIGAQLERDLALHRPFVEALADDKFATVAHHVLAHLEWMRIGSREIGLFEGLHDMFACLRNKGEDYLDFKFGEYPGVAPTKAEAAQHLLRMKEMMRSLGWRTYTADELQARVREDFRARLERRLEAWRQLDAYEARPAGSHDVLAKTPLISDMLLYEGDDPEWLAELRGEERLAASAQFVQRLKDLANSGRVTAGEFEDLFQALL